MKLSQYHKWNGQLSVGFWYLIIFVWIFYNFLAHANCAPNLSVLKHSFKLKLECVMS